MYVLQHRVAALLECDRVIVLHEGKIVQDGPPMDLSQERTGFFANMLKFNEESNEVAD